MPIYDYRCNQCHRRFTVFWRSLSEAASGQPACTRCGSADVRRLVSRVAMLRSEESQLESLSDPGTFGDLDEDDPKSIGRWMRKMGRESGEDLGPEFGEVIDRLEAGQNPEQIESALPDLGGDAAGDPGGDDF